MVRSSDPNITVYPMVAAELSKETAVNQREESSESRDDVVGASDGRACNGGTGQDDEDEGQPGSLTPFLVLK